MSSKDAEWDLKALYLKTVNVLKESDVESPQYNANVLIEYVLSYNKNYVIVNPNEIIENNKVNKVLLLAKERANGTPLQYIVGKWFFGDMEFFVGKGVLIPREDTQAVIDNAIKMLEVTETTPQKILDLCSGSGIIAITLAKKYMNAKVYGAELSKEAIYYLEKNIVHNKADNVQILECDILKDVEKIEEHAKFDLIISNPPYIISKEIETLQKEVKYEPIMALDGGESGYIFYEEIIKLYTQFLKDGGTLAFELGENQYDYVEKLMLAMGYTNINCVRDFGDCKRSIAGVK